MKISLKKFSLFLDGQGIVSGEGSGRITIKQNGITIVSLPESLFNEYFASKSPELEKEAP